ncbi:hypothetical protein OIU77_012845 [Salix suchowensis]|uniref:Uncharacterized protein n=1 Tax=Salix suchowensis TaxID=1278906 RepID=A0ABQ9A543_9ROSI|nr:hypothetical protein OIU77_012845 [Salix suchowensis]
MEEVEEKVAVGQALAMGPVAALAMGPMMVLVEVVDKVLVAAVEIVKEEVKALDRQVGRAMEAEAEVVLERAGMEVAGEEEVVVAVLEEEGLALARFTVARQVLALELEEGKSKAPHEHGGYHFFYVAPFIVICVMK